MKCEKNLWPQAEIKMSFCHDEWNRFVHFLKKNCWWILFFSGSLLCVFSTWLISPDLHIDPDEYIMNQGSRWGGDAQGRQGMTLINILFDMERLNPDFAVIFGWIAICAAGIMMGYLLYRFGLKSPIACLSFGLLTFTSAINVEQFYWYQRIFLLAIGYIMCAAAVGFSYYGIFRRKKRYCLISIVCMMWGFSIYPAFVSVYIVLAILTFLLLYRRWALQEVRENIPYYIVITKQIILFIMSFAINTFLTQHFFYSDGAGVTEMSIYWGTGPISQNISNILQYFKRDLIGGTIYTTWIYGVLGITAIWGAIAECWTNRKKHGNILYILSTIALQLCPVMMAVYAGGEPIVHARFAYPMVLAGNVVFLAGMLIKGKGTVHFSMRFVSAILAAVLFWSQGQIVSRLLYTDRIRIEEDRRVAVEIESRVQTAVEELKPVLFIGTYDNVLNPACLCGEYIGRTIYGWDRSFEPHYLVGSNRTSQILNTIGMSFRGVVSEDVAIKARRLAFDMPAWPAAGSVIDAGECVVIKLCEDEWPEDVMDSKVSPVNLADYSFDFTVGVYIDSTEERDGDLIIKGWIDQPDNGKTAWEPHIYLAERESGICVELSTVKTGRDWLIINGERCINNAFTAMAPRSVFSENMEGYMLVFGYEDTSLHTLSLTIPQIATGLSIGTRSAGLPSEELQEKTVLPMDSGFRYVNAALDGEGVLTSNGQAGIILYGPYTNSVTGTYDITLHYNILSFESSDVGTLDIALDTVQFAVTEFNSSDTSVVLEHVTLEDGHAFEVRVAVPEGMIVQVQSINYKRVP